MRNYFLFSCVLMIILSCSKSRNTTSTVPVVKVDTPRVNLWIDSFRGSYVYQRIDIGSGVIDTTDTSIVTSFYVTHITADSIKISSYIPLLPSVTNFDSFKYSTVLDTLGNNYNAPPFLFLGNDSLTVLLKYSRAYNGGDDETIWSGTFKGKKL